MVKKSLLVLCAVALFGCTGNISGRVTDGSGTPLPDIAVRVTGFFSARATTDINGDYLIEGLPAGSYFVNFDPYNFNLANNRDYIAERYNNRYDIESNTDSVIVSAGRTTGGIHAQLELGGSIAGRVTDESSNPLAGIMAVASCAGCSRESWSVTDNKGEYIIRGLDLRSYKIEFRPNGRNYDSEYFDNRPDSASADTVPVFSGLTIWGIDAQLAESLVPVTTTTVLCPATKVLGADDAKLEALREFRDGRLAQSAVGRRIVQIYYDNAESINEALDSSPALRAVARRVLEMIAPMAGNN